MQTKKALRARIAELEKIVAKMPAFAPCGTPPGLCPHTRKLHDLNGGFYRVCKDEELPWNPAEQVEQSDDKRGNGDNG